MNHKKEDNLGFYTTNLPYALTICPSDKYQFYNRQDRYTKFHNFWYEQLLCYKKYELFIEISHPHDVLKQGYAGPRLHLHGTIEFKTKSELATFLLYGITNLLKISRIEIDTISDKRIWQDYCMKQTIFKNNYFKLKFVYLFQH